jgi:hypothetical protein
MKITIFTLIGMIIIDLNYVSFSKLPFNNNETNFQIEQIVLLISLSSVLTLYIILELPLFNCIYNSFPRFLFGSFVLTICISLSSHTIIVLFHFQQHLSYMVNLI